MTIGILILNHGSPNLLRNAVEVDYFKHTERQDLQVTTVNDFTFVVNRTVFPKMGDVEYNGIDLFHAFIDMTVLAYGRIYRLDFTRYSPAATPGVAELEIISRPTLNDGSTGGPCTQISEDFVFDTLQFTVDITGTLQTQDNNGVITTSCSYAEDITITNSASSLQVGDEISQGDWTFRVTALNGTTTTNSVTYNTPTTGNSTIDAADLLDSLVDDINAIPDLSAEKIGNGIYVESNVQFTVETPTGELFDILAPFSDEDETGTTVHWTAINNITELPTQCKHGLITLVSNSDEEVDDVYLQFIGGENQDGPGVWEETVRPGLRNSFDETTLPYQIVRQGVFDAQGNLTNVKFVVSPIDWEKRLVGDEGTNPRPSWAPDVGEELGRPINRTLFFQNRLVTLSDENVVMSRSADIFNFWVKTALTISAIDPIDIRASNTYASVLTDGIVVTNGLVLFSAFQQFLVSTENDVLAPDAVKIRSLSSYDYNVATNPFTMGSSIGFISEAGQNSRFYEMPIVSRDVDPEVLENSRAIARRFPQGIEFIGHSKEDGFLTFLEYDSPDIYAFRYFNNGDQRIQSAWFRFTIDGTGIFHSMIEEKYYLVQNVNDRNYLVKMDIRDRQSAVSNTGSEYFYRVNLDFKENVTDVAYSQKRTTFTYNGPVLADKISEKKLYAVKGIDIQPVTYENGVYSVHGNWTGPGDLAVGYVYEYRVDFPTFFQQEQSGNSYKSSTATSLTLHRIKMDFGPTGYFKTIVKRLGRDDYEVEYESTPMDVTDADTLPYVPNKVEAVSIYDRNTNVDISLTSEHPAPCTLWSATWEGDFTQRYYKRG